MWKNRYRDMSEKKPPKTIKINIMRLKSSQYDNE